MSAAELCEWLVEVLASGDPKLRQQLREFKAANPGWLERYSTDEQYEIGIILGDIASYSLAAHP